jgi:hypothetical protein
MTIRVGAFMCSPAGADRLRIDKEHRAIQAVAKNFADRARFYSIPAATFGDVLGMLTHEEFDVVHFSCHGSPDRLLFETDGRSSEGLVPLGQIANLLNRRQPGVRAAVFMSCFSQSGLAAVAGAAPYVILLDGEGQDELCIRFAEAFYGHLFQTDSIETAYAEAQELVSYWRGAGAPVLSACLNRRKAGEDSDYVVEVILQRDHILVDLAPILSDLTRLDISYGDFAASVVRKMRLHSWIFRAPLESVLITVGPFLGQFAWTNADDAVTCTKVLKFAETIDARAAEALMDLLVIYNDFSVASYRQVSEPAAPENAEGLEAALESFAVLCGMNHGRQAQHPMLSRALGAVRPWLPAQAGGSISVASMRSAVSMASEKFHSGDRSHAVAYLESALSALHDLVKSLVAELCV